MLKRPGKIVPIFLFLSIFPCSTRFISKFKIGKEILVFCHKIHFSHKYEVLIFIERIIAIVFKKISCSYNNKEITYSNSYF